jgi:hypothetical protein
MMLEAVQGSTAEDAELIEVGRPLVQGADPIRQIAICGVVVVVVVRDKS